MLALSYHKKNYFNHHVLTCLSIMVNFKTYSDCIKKILEKNKSPIHNLSVRNTRMNDV